MSQSSTSHVQWVSRAVAAAKAGNQSVARMQLQKAAEANPDDPAVWLWLGWLADSPSSAAQCLELARSDERFRQIAEAGIEFSRALASFDSESLLTECSQDESLEAVDDVPSRDPVESVEEVAAAVESLRFDDSSEDDPAENDSEAIEPSADSEIHQDTDDVQHTAFESGKATELEASAEAEPPMLDHCDSESAAGDVQSGNADVVSVDEEHDPEVRNQKSESDSVDETTPFVIEPADEQSETEHCEEAVVSDHDSVELTSSEASEIAQSIEAELMKAASELWQLDEEGNYGSGDEADVVSEIDCSPEVDEQSSSPESSVGSTDAVSAPFIETDESQPADTSVDASDADEAEKDFDFASDDFELAAHSTVSEPVPAPDEEVATDHDVVTSTAHEDPWLDQTPVDASQAPLWRKAQSDWFSADDSPIPVADPPAQPGADDNSMNSTTDAAEDVEEASDVVSTSDAVRGEDEPHDEHDHDKHEDVEIVHQTSSRVELVEAGTELLIEKEPVLPQPVDDPAAGNFSGEAVNVPPSGEQFGNAQTPPPLPTSAVARVTASDVWQKAAVEKSSLTEPVREPAPVVAPADPAVFSADESPAVRPTDNDPGRADPLDRKTVLVVDDSPTVRKLVSITLEKRGYKVVSAFDGVAAIKEIAAHNPAMILMDVNMPRLDGYQLCKLVKKHETTKNIPVLMLTGTDGMFDRLRGRLVGCAGYVAKPFTPEELVDIVEEHIHQTQDA